MNYVRVAATGNDYNDCSVIAISTVTGRNPEEVRNELTNEGRGYGKGLRSDILSLWLRTNGFEVMPDCNVPLKWALFFYFQGKYLFLVRDHIFAVIDGVIHDNNEPRPSMKILRIYKYEKC